MGRLIDALFNRMIGGQYDKLEGAAETGKWYEVDTPGAVSADGTVWHGFMKKGSENKVIVCFFGGGVSPDEYTAARGYSAVKEGGAYSDTFSQGRMHSKVWYRVTGEEEPFPELVGNCGALCYRGFPYWLRRSGVHGAHRGEENTVPSWVLKLPAYDERGP